ncbi:MAG: ABC transporter ATP-binding protein [Phycisphaeraceae bacterium]|nr:ABC transporter ATP-binding protein [Phycisphaeraceae bacterium]
MSGADDLDITGDDVDRLDWTLWRRLARRTLKYRGPLAGLISGGIGIAIIEGLRPLVNAALLNEVMEHGLTAKVAWLGALWLLLAAIFCAGVFSFIDAAGRLASGLAFDLREDAFGRLQQLPFAYFDRRPVGWLLSRLTSDCTRVSSIAPWVILDLFWASALMSAAIVAMLWMRPSLALVVLITVPVLIVSSFMFARIMVHSSRRSRRLNSILTANFAESIAGMRTTKALVRERQASEEFGAKADEMQLWSTRHALQGAIYTPVVSTITAIGVALAASVGGGLVGSGELSTGALIAFCQYALLFMYPAQDLAQRFADLLSAQAAAERVQSLIDTEPDICDSPEVVARIDMQRRSPVPGAADDGGPLNPGRIEFEGVSFHYVEGQPIIDDLSLVIEPGQTVALVGPTGGGKTTIASLLCRFYEPNSGRILLGGIDQRDRSLSWLHRSLGVVQQTPWLFNDTIAANIRFGRLDASMEEIIRAASRVGADRFVERLPGGWEFMVGEGGERLSQGQRQLVSLARTVLRDPSIFIMDEATSSVDAETERTIQAAIDEVLRGRISVVIAHRLSTVRRADRILFVAGGRVLEDGPHDLLMTIPEGHYRRLYLQQFEEERGASVLAG